MTADLSDRTDFDNADRGFIDKIDPGVVTTADGRVVWDIDDFGRAVQGEAPDTVNASLWRQSQLTAKHGLYEVTDGIYQVRGLDMSNMTLVEGDTGVIVIDPLISPRPPPRRLPCTAKHRGDQKVSAVIYTHAHIDHFGGVLGVVDADTEVPIVAPEHFLEHAVSENVYAGVGDAPPQHVLRRRAAARKRHRPGRSRAGGRRFDRHGRADRAHPGHHPHRAGGDPRRGPDRVPADSRHRGPAEMNFFFPDHRALCLAENATHNLHNLLTLRGAQVRDPRIWSRYIAEAIHLFADRHRRRVRVASLADLGAVRGVVPRRLLAARSAGGDRSR